MSLAYLILSKESWPHKSVIVSKLKAPVDYNIDVENNYLKIPF